MTDRPNSPAELKREPTPPATSQAPAALRRQGILSASEPISERRRLRAGDLLWSFYGADLARGFYR